MNGVFLHRLTRSSGDTSPFTSLSKGFYTFANVTSPDTTNQSRRTYGPKSALNHGGAVKVVIKEDTLLELSKFYLGVTGVLDYSKSVHVPIYKRSLRRLNIEPRSIRFLSFKDRWEWASLADCADPHSSILPDQFNYYRPFYSL